MQRKTIIDLARAAWRYRPGYGDRYYDAEELNQQIGMGCQDWTQQARSMHSHAKEAREHG